MSPSDAEERVREEVLVIGRILDGDREDYALLVRRYEGPLFRYLLRMLGRPAEAEDLAQESFLRAYLSLASYDPQYRFSTWLFRIATNLALNRLKAEQRVVSLEALRSDPGEPPLEIADSRANCRPEQLAEQSELARLVQECLGDLPPAYRTVVVLRHIADLSYEEIAACTGLPVNTVRSRLHRGRERLGECLGKRLPKEE
jgi:RNA polymerase sigma-70 factor (ECF subfamily)